VAGRSQQLTEPGWGITLAAGVLVLLGVASIYVTDTHYVSGHDGPRNAAKQLVFIASTMGIGWAVLRIGYSAIARHSYALFALGVLALLPLAIAKGFQVHLGGLTAPINGAYRWFRLPGFQLQPSEFMKIAYVLALAWYLRYRCNYRRLGGLLLPMAVSVVPLGLILLEPDLGTVLLLIPVQLAMLFLAGARIRHLAIVVALGLAAAPLAWGQIRGYQRARITAVLLQSTQLRRAVIERPTSFEGFISKRQALEWEASSGYQLVHAKNAIGSGGILGHGWGGGAYVVSDLLPDRHNDFVFAVVAHQWGLTGCLILLLGFGVIVLAGVRIASATADPFGRLLAGGLVTLLATQVVINVGMSLGLMPITGMTLPFVSYGGSSLLSNGIAVALLISVSQHRPFLLATRPFDFARDETPRATLFDVDAERSGDEAAEKIAVPARSRG